MTRPLFSVVREGQVIGTCPNLASSKALAKSSALAQPAFFIICSPTGEEYAATFAAGQRITWKMTVTRQGGHWQV